MQAIWTSIPSAKETVQNKDIYCCSMGTHIAVITTDNFIVFLKRSKNVVSSPNTYTCGACETVKFPDDIDPITGKINLFLSSARGLREEVGFPFPVNQVAVAEQLIKITGFIEKTEVVQRGALGYIDCRDPSIPPEFKISASRVELNLKQNVGKDCKFETASIDIVPFSPSHVLDWLKKEGKTVVPSAIACAFLALRSFYPETDILWNNRLGNRITAAKRKRDQNETN